MVRACFNDCLRRGCRLFRWSQLGWCRPGWWLGGRACSDIERSAAGCCTTCLLPAAVLAVAGLLPAEGETVFWPSSLRTRSAGVGIVAAWASRVGTISQRHAHRAQWRSHHGLSGDLPGADKTGRPVLSARPVSAAISCSGKSASYRRSLTRRQMNQLKHIGEHHLRFCAAPGGLCQSAIAAAASPFSTWLTISRACCRPACPSRRATRYLGSHRQRRRLIEHRQRITHRAFGSAGNPRQCRLIGSDPFFTNMGQMARHHLDRHTAQIKSLTATVLSPALF